MAAKMNDGQNGLRPKWMAAKMDDGLNGGWLKWMTAEMDNGKNGLRKELTPAKIHLAKMENCQN